MALEIHHREIREKIVSLLQTDLNAYVGENYKVSDQYRLIKESDTTVFVQFNRNYNIKTSLGDRTRGYEYHLYLGILKLDHDQAEQAMDDMIFRVPKSLESHPTLDSYVPGGTETIDFVHVDDIDTARGQDKANNYIIVTRVVLTIETCQRGA